MKIKIRQNKSNSLSNNIKKIDIITEHDELVEGATVTWSFIQSSGSLKVFHSMDAEENVFLNYENVSNPNFNLNFEEEGKCKIKIVCCISTPRETVVEVKSLNDDGDIVVAEETVILFNSEYFESGELELEYDDGIEDEWV